jgi:hypothetical protein
MAKSILNTIGSIMEVAQPLSQGEQNFKALHGDLTPTNRDVVPGVTDQDFLFKGGERKMDPPTASYENDEESKKEYDKTLKMREEVETVEEETSEVDEDWKMKGQAEYDARYDGKGKKKKPALDPVGKETPKKNPDVNNDNKTDKEDSYLLNRRKVVGKYLKKEEAVAEAMKGQAEYDARYDGKGKKKPDPTKDKPKVKTDWKELLTRKKEVSEEVEDIDVTDTEDISTEDIPAEDEMPAEDAPEATGGLEDIAADMKGTESDLMDHLMKSFQIAKGMGNEKLETQVGNTLKFFVSEYIGGGE